MIEISFYRLASMSVAADGGHFEQQLCIQKWKYFYLFLRLFLLI
jgi:hypothetical protein